MKNANIFIDVDDTLIDRNGVMLPGANTALRALVEKGCLLYLWSTVGQEYARATAKRLGLADLFEGFSAKPDIVIDDMPGTAVDPVAVPVTDEFEWSATAKSILEKYID